VDAIVSLAWCARQRRGIRLVEPNDNLSREYESTADETLQILRGIKGKSNIWLATTKYYTEYFAIYSLLMKIGIKCEMHDCTIAVCSFLEENGTIPVGYSNILNEDKQLRIDNQYYLKNRKVEVSYNGLAEFVLRIKDINLRLSPEQIGRIRKQLSTMLLKEG